MAAAVLAGPGRGARHRPVPEPGPAAQAWSGGGKTVTIRLNPRYTWSDGKPVSSADVAFDIELIRAAVRENPRNWNIYAPGEFPDNLAAMSTPDARTLVLHLTSAPNPRTGSTRTSSRPWVPARRTRGLGPQAGGPLLNAARPGHREEEDL